MVTFVGDTFQIKLCEKVPWVCSLLPHMDGAAFVTSTIDTRQSSSSCQIHRDVFVIE